MDWSSEFGLGKLIPAFVLQPISCLLQVYSLSDFDASGHLALYIYYPLTTQTWRCDLLLQGEESSGQGLY